MAAPDINRICYGCVNDLPRPGMVCPHCGHDNSIRNDEWGRLPAMTLKNGRFFIGRPLGAGGFGITYLGRDLMAGEFEDARRAIKEFFPMGMAMRRADGITVTPAAAEQVESYERRLSHSREEGEKMARIGAQVNNVVRAFDCFPENGTTYIVMEYIDGATLSDIVLKGGAMTWQEAFTRLKPVLVALKKMHALGIYHMDISPDNIMFRRLPEGGYGEPVILDFGASIEANASDVTRTRSAMGIREGYSPPEQYTIDSDTRIDASRMDEYAICATLYFAITGQAPTSSTARLVGAKVTPISSLDRDIPEHFEVALSRGMSLKATERYASMEDLIDAAERPGLPWRKIGIAAAAVAVVAAVVALLALMLRPEVIVLDAAGSSEWKAQAGDVLVGVSPDDREARFTLEGSESLHLTANLLSNYSWKIETRRNGRPKTIAIKSGKAPG